MRNTLKKISLTVISCLFGTFLFAQQHKALSQAEIEKNANARTEFLIKELKLSPEQEKSVAELTRRIALKTAEAAQPQEELDGYYNDEMANILDAQQMTKFKTLKYSFKSQGAEGDVKKSKAAPGK